MLTVDQKTKWLAALRSGTYIQGRDTLKTLHHTNTDGTQTFGFCCIGVLQDVCGIESDSKHYLMKRAPDDPDGCNFLSEDSAIILSQYDQRELGRLNDAAGQSFAQIADYIEAHIEAV